MDTPIPNCNSLFAQLYEITNSVDKAIEIQKQVEDTESLIDVIPESPSKHRTKGGMIMNRDCEILKILEGDADMFNAVLK